ncbi:unnamed protein product [Schistosoma spindalis]|nr:unnamed protein product [Schistosoma spindale]
MCLPQKIGSPLVIELFIYFKYALRAYSILISPTQSTAIVYNIVFLWINLSICKGHLLLAAAFCAVECYIRMLPGYLMYPVLAAAYIMCAYKLLKWGFHHGD